MKMRNLYILLCVIGIILPYTQFVPFVLTYGWNLQIFFQQLLVNKISIAFSLDLIVAAIVFIIFVFAEGTRLRMRRLWLPITATLAVGLSLGFPLFLFMREIHLKKAS
ncbi:MAG: DUF2834 domain-containing protein [bacterium]